MAFGDPIFLEGQEQTVRIGNVSYIDFGEGYERFKKGETKTEADVEVKVTDIMPVSDDMMETAIIYEANIRQYSPEGTFNQFTKDYQ